MAEYQVTLRFRSENQQVRNVLNYHLVGTEPIDWADIETQISASWATNLAKHYTPGLVYLGITVLRLDPGFVSLDYNHGTSGIAGTAGDEPNATQLAALVTLIGEQPLTPARGRIYFAAPVRDRLGVSAFFEAPFTTDLAAFMDDMLLLTDGNGNQLELVIYSSVYPGKAALPFNKVASYIVRTTPATQRKRRIGVGF